MYEKVMTQPNVDSAPLQFGLLNFSIHLLSEQSNVTSCLAFVLHCLPGHFGLYPSNPESK